MTEPEGPAPNDKTPKVPIKPYSEASALTEGSPLINLEKEAVHTYICTLLNKTNKQQTKFYREHPKIHVTLSVDQSVHEAAKFLAPFLDTTVSDLYVEGLLKHLESLVDKLPSNIQLNIVRQIEAKPDSAMLDLELDWFTERILAHVQRLRKLKPTPEWKDTSKKRWRLEELQKLLPKAIRLAQRSGNEEFRSLVFEAREFLRGESQ
jgi:hypothetical protein